MKLICNSLVLMCARMACLSGFSHSRIPLLDHKLTLDKAGRVLIPKALRHKLHLSAGDTLENRKRRRRNQAAPRALSCSKNSVWVYRGELRPMLRSPI